MPSPMPVVITDCVGDCITILHAAEGYVWLGITAATFFAGAVVLLLAIIAVSVGFRRH